MGKQALVCIDMQNDFVLPDAPLLVKGAMECLPHCKCAVDAARRASIPVVWVIREHDSKGVGRFTGPACNSNAVYLKCCVPGTTHMRCCGAAPCQLACLLAETQTVIL